eukprot:TRINITY_DN2257_c0_g1_i1.p1 TRINITY_DN2257_c0_g1~~TRINITY_DN2257_c0_g1_i1.p1  ORF type:complete len:319 (-),score=36.91 TRINITY_DN2257_c0_g1_i1:51-1007(-)
MSPVGKCAQKPSLHSDIELSGIPVYDVIFLALSAVIRMQRGGVLPPLSSVDIAHEVQLWEDACVALLLAHHARAGKNAAARILPHYSIATVCDFLKPTQQNVVSSRIAESLRLARIFPITDAKGHRMLEWMFQFQSGPKLPEYCSSCSDSFSYSNLEAIYFCEHCSQALCRTCAYKQREYKNKLASWRPIVDANKHRLVLTPFKQLVQEQSAYTNGYSCDVCHKQNGCPAHCAICQYDLCTTCQRQPRAIYDNKGHPLTVTRLRGLRQTLPQYHGGFTCDLCARGYDNPDASVAHCDLCEFDLCTACQAASQYMWASS